MLKEKSYPLAIQWALYYRKKSRAKMNLSKGDELYLVDEPKGFTLLPYRKVFEQQMTAAGKIMKKYRIALHQLAK